MARKSGGSVTAQRNNSRYPTRGQGSDMDMFNSPLTVKRMAGDVVPEVDNPSYPFRDTIGLIPSEPLADPKKIARIK